MGLCQNGGVLWLAVLKTIKDVFDAVAGVFEFFVERFVVMSAMILQTLEQVLWEVGLVACWVAVSSNLLEFVHEHTLIIL